jgi:hypothetical protein
MHTCLIPDGYRDKTVLIYRHKSIVNGNKDREVAYYWFIVNLVFKWQICYTEMTNLLQITIDVLKS